MFLKQKDEEITEIILKEAKCLEDVLNKKLLAQFATLHNISPSNSMLSLKQEVIAKKAYFMDVKKKYALHITNNEGVPVDNVYVRGLVTRRSDYSAWTKKNIQCIIDMLISDTLSFTKIREFVDKTRLEYITLCRQGKKEAATKPVSYAKENYKTVPPQIYGMQLWNECMYNHFVVGTRGYMFKIKSIDPYKAPDRAKDAMFKFKKCECVVLPYEEDKLPDFFDVDVDAMVKYCWDDRVKEILSPIWNKIYKDKIVENEIMTWE